MYANQGSRPYTAVGQDEVERFFRDIEESGALPYGIESERAVSTVVGTLLARVTGGQAREFVNSMPPRIRELLRSQVEARTEEPAVFDRDAYLQRVADQLAIDRGEAESLANTVFAAVNDYMPSKEIDDVESQLPPDMKELWRPR